MDKLLFEKAKHILCSDLNLVHINPNLPIIVSTDALNCGAAICHKLLTGLEKAIEFGARTLTKSKKNYIQTERSISFNLCSSKVSFYDL